MNSTVKSQRFTVSRWSTTSRSDPATLALDTYAMGVVPAVKGFFAGMPQEPDKNATTAVARPRGMAAIYTDAQPALRHDQTSTPGMFVITHSSMTPTSAFRPLTATR